MRISGDMMNRVLSNASVVDRATIGSKRAFLSAQIDLFLGKMSDAKGKGDKVEEKKFEQIVNGLMGELASLPATPPEIAQDSGGLTSEDPFAAEEKKMLGGGGSLGAQSSNRAVAAHAGMSGFDDDRRKAPVALL